MTGQQIVENQQVIIHEKMTYNQLFQLSEPGRLKRSLTVRGPPLGIESYQDAVYYFFNFKSFPSTTGLRHKGYVRFMKPTTRGGRNTPLSQVYCEVDCSCQDYKFRFAWVIKQKGAGKVGPNSLNQAWNKAPRKSNPSGAISLCKHLLAMRDWIYGAVASFPRTEPDTANKLSKLTKWATKRWINIDSEMDKAHERERLIAKSRALKNIGVPPDVQGKAVGYLSAKEPLPLPGDGDKNKGVALDQPKEEKPGKKSNRNTTNPKNKSNNSESLFKSAKNVVIIEQAENMTNTKKHLNLQEGVAIARNGLTEAIKLVAEMDDDINARIGGHYESPDTEDGAPLPDDMPPVGDFKDEATEGQDTEALDLLREIRDLMQQMVGEESPVEDKALDDLEAPMPAKPKGPKGSAAMPDEDEPVHPGAFSNGM